jgi:hypothetical protein
MSDLASDHDLSKVKSLWLHTYKNFKTAVKFEYKIIIKICNFQTQKAENLLCKLYLFAWFLDEMYDYNLIKISNQWEKQQAVHIFIKAKLHSLKELQDIATSPNILYQNYISKHFNANVSHFPSLFFLLFFFEDLYFKAIQCKPIQLQKNDYIIK